MRAPPGVSTDLVRGLKAMAAGFRSLLSRSAWRFPVSPSDRLFSRNLHGSSLISRLGNRFRSVVLTRTREIA